MNYQHPYSALKRNAQQFPNKTAFTSPLNKRSWTWKEVEQDVSAIACWLQSLGLQKADRVAILSKNCPEWVLFDLAALSLGLVSVPLYPQSSEDEIRYILDEAEVRLMVLDKELSLDVNIKLVRIETLLEAVAAFKNSEFKPQLHLADELATLIYTSGTTGEPKGVMHSMRGIYLGMRAAIQTLPVGSQDQMLSYLPLSHVVERMLSEFIPLYTGAAVAFVGNVERLTKVLPAVRPTIFVSVPRIWEILRFKVERELEQKFLWRRLPATLRMKIFGPLIRKKLGFSRARYLLSGSAALSRETAEGLDALGLRITEGYGLTETLAVSTFNLPGDEVFGSVGKVHDGVMIRIMDDGEIALKADFHFQGYYKKPEQTKEVLKDGWFHTGDVGYLDSQRNLYLTDRKKNIFKTSNGKYVAPLPIETHLKSHAMISEVMVVGENRPHCVALAAINPEFFDEKTLLDHLQTVNKKLAFHEKIHSLGCSFSPWSIEAGELTPTMKLKRKKLLIRYEKEIEDLYRSRKKIEFFDYMTERNQIANSGI